MQPTNQRQNIRKAGTIVIKIGSSRVSGNQRDINEFMYNLVTDVRKLRDEGRRVIIVSSGAVSQGKMVDLGKKNWKQLFSKTSKTASLQVRQAFAAMGQSKLMSLYEGFFSKINIPIAQILFGILDVHEKSGYQNLKNTFNQLLTWNVLPIVNENDSIATEELKFGDNDILSSLVAALVGADLLIILTGTNGFYKNKKRVGILETITESDFKAAKGPSGPGTGGMKSKLLAAEVMHANGIDTAILPGEMPGVISKFINGEDIGTLITSGKPKNILTENEIKKYFNDKFFKKFPGNA